MRRYVVSVHEMEGGRCVEWWQACAETLPDALRRAERHREPQEPPEPQQDTDEEERA